MWSDSVRAPSSAGGQPDDNSIVWNTDDERDYSDYEYSPPSPMAHYPGPREPLARFMADLPDLGDFDKHALNEALRGLPVPDSGPAPPGISLQDAIKVQYTYIINYNIYIYSIIYVVRCTVVVYDVVCDVVYDIVYDVVYDIKL